MNKDMIAFIHDDITWCMKDNCPIINCMRNKKNMMNPSGLHSYAEFNKTDECPVYRMERQADIERQGNK